MWDNIFGAWLYSFENESWIVVSQKKILCRISSDLSRFSTWFKSKTAHFYFQPLFNALNMLSALRLTYLTCCIGHWSSDWHRDGEPWRCKTHHTHTFSSTKLLTRVTVADKLVLVNPFWWNNHLFIVYALFIHCFKLICTARSLTVNIDLSDVTNKYYTVLYRTVVIYEKKNRSLVFSGSRKIPTRGPLGWDFSGTTEHQW